MTLYSISGKFEQYGRWSILPEDFEGFFVVDDDTGVLRGVTTDKYYAKRFKQRFIWGLKRGEELHFFKVSNEMELDPLFYSFSDYHQEGAWGNLVTLFAWRFFLQGRTKITITKVIENAPALEDDLLDKYAKMNSNGCWNFNETIEDNMPMLEDLAKFVKSKKSMI